MLARLCIIKQTEWGSYGAAMVQTAYGTDERKGMMLAGKDEPVPVSTVDGTAENLKMIICMILAFESSRRTQLE